MSKSSDFSSVIDNYYDLTLENQKLAGENALKRKEKLTNKIIKTILKNYKRKCVNCGAFLPKYQFVCGMCKSSYTRKASQDEIVDIINNYIKW